MYPASLLYSTARLAYASVSGGRHSSLMTSLYGRPEPEYNLIGNH